MSLKLEKSQNQNVSSTFSQHKMRLLALLQNQMTDFSTLPLYAIIGSTPLGPKVTIVERVKHDNFYCH